MAKVRSSKRGRAFQMVQFRLSPTQFTRLKVLLAELGVSIQAFMTALVAAELRGKNDE